MTDLLLYSLLLVLLVYFSINLSRILLLTWLKTTFDLVWPPSGKLWLSLAHLLLPNLLLISIFVLIIIILFKVKNHSIQWGCLEDSLSVLMRLYFQREVTLGGRRCTFKDYFESEASHRHEFVFWKGIEGNINSFEVFHMIKVKILFSIVDSEFAHARQNFLK
jgi:hypothetical protein